MTLQYFKKWAVILLFVFTFLPNITFAIGRNNYVSTQTGKGYFTLSAANKATSLYVSSTDYIGVTRALKDLQTDIGKVTGVTPTVVNNVSTSQKEIVIVGTIGKSEVIDKLIKNKKIDVSAIKGKWENFLVQVVENPLPGVARALVISVCIFVLSF